MRFRPKTKPLVSFGFLKAAYSLLIMGFALFANTPVSAQAYFGYLSGGFATQHNKSFSNYIDNFNGMQANVLQKPLRGFKPGFSYGWGLGVSNILEGEQMIGEGSIFATNSFARTTAKYSNGQKRVYDLARHYAGIESSVGFWFNDRAGLLFLTGLQIGRTILDTYFVYQDGTESHGRELRWNGVFSGYNMGSLLGVKYIHMLGERVSAFAKFSYNFDFSKKKALWDGDNEYADFRGIPLYPDKDFDLPGSVNGGGYSYGGPWVRNRFDGLALQFGLSFYIPE